MAERTQFGPLNTDGPPDKLGAGAFRIQDVVPLSPVSVAPRPGVSLEETLASGSPGREWFADGLPENEGGGVLLAMMDNQDGGGGDTDTSNQWNTEYIPDAIPTELQAMTGYSAETKLYGIVF